MKVRTGADLTLIYREGVSFLCGKGTCHVQAPKDPTSFALLSSEQPSYISPWPLTPVQIRLAISHLQHETLVSCLLHYLEFSSNEFSYEYLSFSSFFPFFTYHVCSWVTWNQNLFFLRILSTFVKTNEQTKTVSCFMCSYECHLGIKFHKLWQLSEFKLINYSASNQRQRVSCQHI